MGMKWLGTLISFALSTTSITSTDANDLVFFQLGGLIAEF
jgi:hypothetical protein